MSRIPIHELRRLGITSEDIDMARATQEAQRRNGYAVSAEYDARQNCLVVGLSSGVTIMVPVHLVEDLAGADPDDLAEIEITPSGLGLHWPRLDADVYVPGFMKGIYGTRRWMAALLGAEGGKSSSPAKAAAARTNGAKGGRPRKQA